MDTIECWFFENEADARKDNLENAQGYAKTVDGILKEAAGNTDLNHCYIRSHITGYEDSVDSNVAAELLNTNKKEQS